MNFQVQHLGGVFWGGHIFFVIHTAVVPIVVKIYIVQIKEPTVPDLPGIAWTSIPNATSVSVSSKPSTIRLLKRKARIRKFFCESPQLNLNDSTTSQNICTCLPATRSLPPVCYKDSYLESSLKIDIADVVLGVYVLALQHCILTPHNRLRWPFNDQSSCRWTQIMLWVIHCDIIV